MKVDCAVTSRFAHTVMTSTALNKANVSQEIFFEVELPKTAFITNFSMYGPCDAISEEPCQTPRRSGEPHPHPPFRGAVVDRGNV